MPRVSVIIPTHNRAHVLAEALDSVLAQGYRDFEITVVDDASTDSTRGVLDRYTKGHPPLVRHLRREDNGGAGAARNTGIRATDSEFICFLDADDLYLPRRLEAAVGCLDRGPHLAAVYTDCRVEGPGGVVQEESAVRASCLLRAVASWRETAIYEPMNTDTMTIRRECLERVGLFDERLRRGQDSELWLRLTYRYPIGYHPEVLAVWRRRDALRRTPADLRRTIGVWQSVLEWLDDAPRQDRRFARARLARAHWSLALQLLGEGDPEAATARRQARRYSTAEGFRALNAVGALAWHCPWLVSPTRAALDGTRRVSAQLRGLIPGRAQSEGGGGLHG